MNKATYRHLNQEISSLDEIFEEHMKITQKAKVSVNKSAKIKDDINKFYDIIYRNKKSRNNINF